MKKSYYFDYEKYSKALDEIYPLKGISNYLDYKALTYDNFEKIKKTLEDVINNPQLKDYHLDEYREYEEITCLPEDVKKIFDELFSNPDISLYGHGGMAKEIIESGNFKCHYANLESHFVPLSHTDASLDKLNKWPHRGHNQIAILAINETEYNPLYKESTNPTDIDKYTISSDYFVGYYDSENKMFTPNPNFKLNHEYNPENTIYEMEDRFGYRHLATDDKLVNEYFRCLEKIKGILIIASNNKSLSKEGYIGVKKQVINYINKANEIQNKLTPEYIENLINSENNNSIAYNNFDSDDWDTYEDDFEKWDLDDWNFEEENNSKTR